jgi:hypothetical protein
MDDSGEMPQTGEILPILKGLAPNLHQVFINPQRASAKGQ